MSNLYKPAILINYPLGNNCNYCHDSGRTWELSKWVPLGSRAMQFCFDCGKVSNKMSIFWVFLYAATITLVSACAYYYFNLSSFELIAEKHMKLGMGGFFALEYGTIFSKVIFLLGLFLKFMWLLSIPFIPMLVVGFCFVIVSYKVTHFIFMISSSDYKQYPEPNLLWVLSLVLIVFALAILSLISFFIVFAWIVGG